MTIVIELADHRKGIGQEIPDYEEVGITLWTTCPQLARTYRSPSMPNAFLAGDAAHSFPPTGGLGLNTGVGDVHNLIWKIHAVESTWAGESFLDSVSIERLPVARENCRQSKLNERKIFRLIDGIKHQDLTAEEILANASMREKIQTEIHENREHFHSLNLQLGYVYGQDMKGGPGDYRKEVTAGARLPHFWIEVDGCRVSTLDLVDGMGFILVSEQGFTSLTRFDVGKVAVGIRQIGRDFCDLSGELSRFLQQSRVQSLLVRPDQHIVGQAASLTDAGALLSQYLSH